MYESRETKTQFYPVLLIPFLLYWGKLKSDFSRYYGECCAYISNDVPITRIRILYLNLLQHSISEDINDIE
jgi:hypothetical protein